MLLDGFDLVVLGAVIPILLEDKVFGITPAEGYCDRHDRLDRHDDRRYDDRHHHRLPGPPPSDDLCRSQPAL